MKIGAVHENEGWKSTAARCFEVSSSGMATSSNVHSHKDGLAIPRKTLMGL